MIPQRKVKVICNAENFQSLQDQIPGIHRRACEAAVSGVRGWAILTHIRSRLMRWDDAETIYDLGSKGFRVNDLVAEWLDAYSRLPVPDSPRVKIPGLSSFLVLPHFVSAHRIQLDDWARKLRTLEFTLKKPTEEKKCLLPLTVFWLDRSRPTAASEQSADDADQLAAA